MCIVLPVYCNVLINSYCQVQAKITPLFSLLQHEYTIGVKNNTYPLNILTNTIKISHHTFYQGNNNFIWFSIDNLSSKIARFISHFGCCDAVTGHYPSTSFCKFCKPRWLSYITSKLPIPKSVFGYWYTYIMDIKAEIPSLEVVLLFEFDNGHIWGSFNSMSIIFTI